MVRQCTVDYNSLVTSPVYGLVCFFSWRRVVGVSGGVVLLMVVFAVDELFWWWPPFTIG